MSTFPEISIIVPVYNAEEYLRECIDSILVQSHADFELLLIDDGSHDRSGLICDEYAMNDGRVRVLHKQNGGVSSARNLGLENAVGKWVTFIDSDDWISNDFLKRMLDCAVENDADIVVCDFNFALPDGSFERHETYNWNKSGLDGLNEYIATPWTILCGGIQKKELYDWHNFRSPEGISYCEDFHIVMRVFSQANMVAKLNAPLYNYRQHNNSVMHNLSSKTEADEQWVYLDIINYFKSQGVYESLKQSLAWRTLKGAQEMVLDINKFEDFRNYNPDKRDYIFSCPFINKKLKFLMWCVTHHLSPVAYAFVKFRNILGR